jgi:hypothetical protein
VRGDQLVGCQSLAPGAAGQYPRWSCREAGVFSSFSERVLQRIMLDRTSKAPSVVVFSGADRLGNEQDQRPTGLRSTELASRIIPSPLRPSTQRSRRLKVRGHGFIGARAHLGPYLAKTITALCHARESLLWAVSRNAFMALGVCRPTDTE